MTEACCCALPDATPRSPRPWRLVATVPAHRPPAEAPGGHPATKWQVRGEMPG